MNNKKTDFKGLTQLDTAVFLQEMIVLNGMLVHRTKEQRESALQKLEILGQ